MSIVRACAALIAQLRPTYWAIENVRGAVRWFRTELGKPTKRCGSYILWGELPLFYCRPITGKEKHSGTNPEKRSEIPLELSFALCRGIENTL